MLYIISTPIGNAKDMTPRALQAIEQSELIIGEERKPTLKLLKQLKLTGRPVELLNEHSDEKDLIYFLEQCKHKTVGLVSDCGTPGFCDPGANLVKLCRDHGVQVVPVPGASSLMCFLSVCGYRLDEFYFRGFIPANNEKRQLAYNELKTLKVPFILMDTPYRLNKMLEELNTHFANNTCVVGYRLTCEDEKIIEGKPSHVLKHFNGLKGEFILLVV